jgi:hypothetical protein
MLCRLMSHEGLALQLSEVTIVLKQSAREINNPTLEVAQNIVGRCFVNYPSIQRLYILY